MFKFNVYDTKWNYVDTFWSGSSTFGLETVGDYKLEKNQLKYNANVYYKRME
jgi:hypothetical protein